MGNVNGMCVCVCLCCVHRAPTMYWLWLDSNFIEFHKNAHTIRSRRSGRCLRSIICHNARIHIFEYGVKFMPRTFIVLADGVVHAGLRIVRSTRQETNTNKRALQKPKNKKYSTARDRRRENEKYSLHANCGDIENCNGRCRQLDTREPLHHDYDDDRSEFLLCLNVVVCVIACTHSAVPVKKKGFCFCFWFE